MIIIEKLMDDLESFQENDKAVNPAKFHLSKTRLPKAKESIQEIDADKAVQ
jgi:hypothetical protein